MLVRCSEGLRKTESDSKTEFSFAIMSETFETSEIEIVFEGIKSVVLGTKYMKSARIFGKDKATIVNSGDMTFLPKQFRR